MRGSQRDHLWAFKRYSVGARCFYLNVTFGGYPTYLKNVSFDLIIFDWSFVGGRVERSRFNDTISRIEELRFNNAIKICMPQDEFTSMDLLCNFINQFGITHIFTVAPESEWSKIYRTVNRDKVRFIPVLTGYLDEEVVIKWSSKTRGEIDRPLDIGYRTVSTAIWGQFNLLKATIAVVFQKEAMVRGLVTDIKVGAEYFKMGDEWLQFLSMSRFTLGIEGGSRILDWDGSILAAVTDHLKRKPDTTFKNLALTCVPAEREGEINVVAISPRNLEACLTRTVQILVEGEFNGILKPNVHYIPLKADFSNIEEIFERMKDESARSRMAEIAYQDIVASGQYTYRSMVEKVLHETIGLYRSDANAAFPDSFLILINRAYVLMNILFLYLFSRARDVRNFFWG
jgi:hypothetical protein